MPSPPPSRIHALSAVARLLGCTTDDLNTIARDPDQRHLYRRLRIPKKHRKRRGQFRTVYQPNQLLALIQKNFTTWLAEHVEFPEYVQGFVHKRSIVTNAKFHLSQRILLHADIKNFFDSITIDQVADALRSVGFDSTLADTLAKCCTLNSRLPQGSSASPLLANLVCRHLDVDLNTLARASQCRYSRYADDLTISGETVPKSADVKALVEKHGFVLRDDRCRIQKRGRSQYVTGLSVFDQASPRVPGAMKRRLRLELHYASRYGLEDHLGRISSEEDPLHALARLHGWMSFIYSVEGTAQMRLYDRWIKVNEEMFAGGPGNPYENGDPFDY